MTTRRGDRKTKEPRPSTSAGTQASFYLAGEYADQGDRLLVQDGDTIELYSVDLRLAQHWYSEAWRGRRFDCAPFRGQLLDGDLQPEQAKTLRSSGLVLAQCVRHGKGMPVVDHHNGHPIYGSGVEILIGEVFEAALGGLIENETGIAGLTISPMHTGYALHEGRSVGKASIEIVSKAVRKERPDLRAHRSPDGTITMFFSDIEGSTAANARLGDRRWMEILREHDSIMRRQIGLHRGFEVKTIGDAFMVAFQSAIDSVRCAAAIQREFARRNEDADHAIRVRIGLHTGEAVKVEDDFYGRHINYAARVSSQAKRNQVIVSSLLKDVVAPSGEFVFRAMKPVALKGFPGTHILYELRWEPR